MEKIIILRYAEIHLKGNNRGYFERLLMNNIKASLKGIECKLNKYNARYIVSSYPKEAENEIVWRLKKIFGLHSLSVAFEVDSTLQQIQECVLTKFDYSKTFRVTVNRADKKFLPSSTELSKKLGTVILEANPHLKVDLHNPQTQLFVDIREHGKTFIYIDIIKAPGGMPVGSSGKGMLLLSGGIDSPVSGYLMAKRGMSLTALHFHSFPHTSLLAKEKVLRLAKQLVGYLNSMKLIMVNTAKIQEEIHKKCPDGLQITILRRFMMRIAEQLANKEGASAIITGESLGQVASQTIEGIICSNAVTSLPVLRPLIGFDKQEIVEIAQKIETYEVSIMPYEDCCTVFLPKNPSTKPKLKVVDEVESRLNVDSLVLDALNTVESFDF